MESSTQVVTQDNETKLQNQLQAGDVLDHNESANGNEALQKSLFRASSFSDLDAAIKDLQRPSLQSSVPNAHFNYSFSSQLLPSIPNAHYVTNSFMASPNASFMSNSSVYPLNMSMNALSLAPNTGAHAMWEANAPLQHQIAPAAALTEFAGIFRGTSDEKAYILMTRPNLVTLNQTFERLGIKQRNIYHPLQKWDCSVAVERTQYEWAVGKEQKVRVAHNALCTFTFDLTKNAIINIVPIVVEGVVKHINESKQVWICSNIQLTAIEKASEENAEGKYKQKVEMVKILDVSHWHSAVQRRYCSYMVLDTGYFEPGEDLKVADSVQFMLKLSTRTNKKISRELKPIFTQAWNVTKVKSE